MKKRYEVGNRNNPRKKGENRQLSSKRLNASKTKSVNKSTKVEQILEQKKKEAKKK
jgi:hypothetical protein